MLFPVLNFLKYVVPEVVLFSIVAFKTLIFHKVYSVATHMRCCGISDSINTKYKFSPDSDS